MISLSKLYYRVWLISVELCTNRIDYSFGYQWKASWNLNIVIFLFNSLFRYMRMRYSGICLSTSLPLPNSWNGVRYETGVSRDRKCIGSGGSLLEARPADCTSHRVTHGQSPFPSGPFAPLLFFFSLLHTHTHTR